MAKRRTISKYFRVDIPVFNTYVEIIIAPKNLWGKTFKLYVHADDKSVNEIEEHVANDNGLTNACFMTSGGVAAIFLQPNFDLDTLVHEAVHVGLTLLKDRGVKDANTEAEAYLISHIFYEVYRKAKKIGAKK